MAEEMNGWAVVVNFEPLEGEGLGLRLAEGMSGSVAAVLEETSSHCSRFSLGMEETLGGCSIHRYGSETP